MEDYEKLLAIIEYEMWHLLNEYLIFDHMRIPTDNICHKQSIW